MRRIVVLRAEPLSPSVRALRLSCVDGQPLRFVPGQWVHLRVARNQGLGKRPYSIASAPDAEHPDEFDVAVTAVREGSVSLALHEVAPGDTLEFDGPYGFFTREGAEDKPSLFVATGTGVCPLRAMIVDALRAPAGPALTLLFGCRTQADILYGSEFAALAAAHPRFKFHVTLSQPDPGWSGRAGYVQRQLADLIDVAQRPHVYVCGLSPMINEVRATLKQQLGYDRRLIHSERYD